MGCDVFIDELIPHIDATYRTVAERGGRGLEGFSQGGRGTVRLGQYPSATPVRRELKTNRANGL